MMRIAVAFAALSVVVAGCGPLAGERLIGTWVGTPQLENPLLQLAAGQAKVQITFNRDGSTNVSGQTGSWRVVAADDKSATVEISSQNPTSKTKVTQEWKLTWVDADHFTTNHPDLPQAKLHFERKKS